MKKLFSIIIALGILSLAYQFIVTFFMFKHTSNYSVKNNEDEFMVKEKFKKSGEHNMYSFYMTDKNKNNFVFSYDVDLNKQSKVIVDVLSYHDGDLYCVAPILKNKSVENIECIDGGQLVSYSYIKKNKNITDFINQINNSGYKFSESLEKDYTITDTKYNLTVYKEIPDNIYFSMWGYSKLYILNNKEIKMQDLLNHDSYSNENYSILVDKYYVTLNTDNDSGNSFYVANIKDGGKALVESDYDISKNIYFNGVYNKKAYFTDINNKKQYYVDPYREEIKEVGTSDKCKYFDGKTFQDVNISMLANEKKYFKEKNIPDELSNKYPDKKIIESYGNYYFLDVDGSVYQIVSDYYDQKVKLFQLDDFKELKVLNNNVYGVSNDTVYIYNNKIGLKKAIVNRELIYNYKNIYDVYES